MPGPPRSGETALPPASVADPSRGGAAREGWIAAAAAVLILLAIPFDLVPLLRGPAPYPPEWQWELRAGLPGGRVLPAAFCAAGLLGLLVLSGLPQARSNPRRVSTAILAGGVALGWGFQLALLDVEPDGSVRTLFLRAVSRTGTSYYTVAVSPEAEDPLFFLDRHAELLEGFRKAAKHAATHPPGPVLFYRAFIGLAERSPGLTRIVLERAGFPESNPHRPRPQHTAVSRAGALLGALAIALCCAATSWPVASLARRAGSEPRAAARVGVLWNLLPAPALMTPQFDQALALPVAAATAALAASLAGEGRGERAGKAVMAGLAAATALFISYGAAAFLLMGALAAFALAPPGPGKRARAMKAAALAAATAGGLLALTVLAGHEPLEAARKALSIHRDFYTRPRSYTLWLFFNLIDLALFLGVPLAVIWALRTVRSARVMASRPAAGGGDAGHRLRVMTAAGLAILVLSGVTRGEVGRIWLPIMPLLLVAAWARGGASAEPGMGSDREPAEEPTRTEALLCGGLLAAQCVAMRLSWQIP